MKLFGLDPQSIVARVRASGRTPYAPSLTKSILIGSLGFMLVSVCGFLPWVMAGKWGYAHPSEMQMYGACALVFVVLSGLLLHPLIVGPGRLLRFYGFFLVAFGVYAAGWIAGWMGLRGQHMHLRSIVGLFVGTAGMTAIFALAFEASEVLLVTFLVLFISNSLGYFIGGVVEGALHEMGAVDLLGVSLSGLSLDVFMKVMWGVCYGIGFGTGLGCAFYWAQIRTRALLSLE